jgi:hypothetical protein
VDKACAASYLGDNGVAVTLYDQAIAIRERLVHQEGRGELADDLAVTYMNKAAVVSLLGDNRAAAALFDQAIAISERLVHQEGHSELAKNLAMTYLDCRRDPCTGAHRYGADRGVKGKGVPPMLEGDTRPQAARGSPMWSMIPSLDPFVRELAPAFTQPSFVTSCEFFLAWVMCLGRHRLCRVADSAHPQTLRDHSRRHGLDVYYNFFERSAWTPDGLAYRVALLVLTRLAALGLVALLVDDTLAHKRGRSVWGLGWWRDAVASTQKRVATASGHNWVVLAVAVCVPGGGPMLALPLLARLHLPGKGQPSCPALARAMLEQVLGWFPDRRFTLVGDGAYACKALLEGLDPRVPRAKPGKRGPKAKKGPRLPGPKEAAAKADRKRTAAGAWVWRAVEVLAYGEARSLVAFGYEAVWPRVLGLRPVQVVVVRDPAGRMRDAYLFTTDLTASLEWVALMFAWRWSIEVLFRASKQVLDIEAPQQWSREAVEKVAPWVWSMQSVMMVWYVTEGRGLPEAEELRARMGEWDSEWSLRHMVQVLRRAILNATINPDSADQAKLTEMVKTLKNWANLAA